MKSTPHKEQTVTTTWITWRPRGRDAYTMPTATVAHAAPVRSNDVLGGSYPLACGRWAPDGFDAIIETTSKRHCRRCEKALAARKEQIA